MRFCRLCGAESLTPLITEDSTSLWFHCQGCGSDLSDATFTGKRKHEGPKRLDNVANPLGFLIELHAATPMNGRVRVETLAPGQGRPGILHLFSPAFLEKTVTELGFKVVGRPKKDDELKVWELLKVDGL